MTWTNADWIQLGVVMGIILIPSAIIYGAFWLHDKLNPKPPYKGLYDDGRTPKELTTEELQKALSKGGHALREWHAVITELVLRDKKE